MVQCGADEKALLLPSTATAMAMTLTMVAAQRQHAATTTHSRVHTLSTNCSMLRRSTLLASEFLPRAVAVLPTNYTISPFCLRLLFGDAQSVDSPNCHHARNHCPCACMRSHRHERYACACVCVSAAHQVLFSSIVVLNSVPEGCIT